MGTPWREDGRRYRLNRGILGSGWGLLVRRLEDKAPGRVEKDVKLSLRANSELGDGVAQARLASRPISRTSAGHPEGGPEQMTATESFDAGIARQIGHYAEVEMVAAVPAGKADQNR